MQASVIDDSPILRFHRKLRLQCGGGTFLDGYVLSAIAVAIPGIKGEYELSAAALSSLAAAAIVGIFVGSIIFGPLSDRLGRHKLFTLDLAAFVAFSALTYFVTDLWQLVLLRLLAGIAVGADYPLAMTMVTEWMPRRHRTGGIGMLVMWWFGGAIAAYVFGYAIVAAFGDDAWRLVLASATIPAAITLLLRVGMPESPRWLLSRGRQEEALEILKSVYGQDATLEGLEAPVKDEERGRLRELFSRKYIRRTVFASGPYAAQATAFYVILTFEPTILNSFGLGHGHASYVGAAVTSIIFLIGVLPVQRLAESFGRRRLYIWSFALMVVPLAVLGIFPLESAIVVVACFCFYALVSGPTSVLSWSYPNELFPTKIRATAVGFATSMTRISAAIGTFLLPISIDSLGIRPTMLIGAGVVAAGLLMCILWAPETSGQSLDEASAIPAEAAGLEVKPV